MFSIKNDEMESAEGPFQHLHVTAVGISRGTFFAVPNLKEVADMAIHFAWPCGTQHEGFVQALHIAPGPAMLILALDAVLKRKLNA